MHLVLVKIARPSADAADLAGAADRPDAADTAAALRDRGAGSVAVRPVDAEAGEIDAVIADLGDRRLVIDAALPGLNLVLHRLLRAGRLAEVETAVLTAEPIGYLSGQGLPNRRDRQLAIAVAAPARLVGVVKDDSGGVCVDGAEVTPWPEAVPGPEAGPAPGQWWLRAIVDDERLCDGTARRVLLRRRAPAELTATAYLGLGRRRTRHGRSLQLACAPAAITADGVARDQPRSKRTFWSEPSLWKLALPVVGTP